MKTILYLSYGKGPHEQEVIFSILSAWRWQDLDKAGVRVVIYTDHPESFAGLPVEIELISTEQWTIWSGAAQFNHRRKIMALQHAIRKSDAATVMLDGDTWWRRPPIELFDRIAPGRSVMHLREGLVNDVHSPTMEAMASLLENGQFTGPDRQIQSIPLSASMWNSGVVGLDPSDAVWLEDIIWWVDSLSAQSKLHVLEQFAFSHVLEEHTQLEEAGDLVFHYWPPYLHDPFRTRLSSVMEASAKMTLEDRANWCYAQRPQPTMARRGKVVAKRMLQKFGFLKSRIRANEW
jgi:hypothetical protein